MKCENGHDNSSAARFCSQCGAKLSISCPACGTVLPADAKFCTNCGTAIGQQEATSDLSRYLPEGLLSKLRSARSGGSMRGERRTVTMLFADLQGSTAAAERLDPEDWAEIANGAFEHLIAPVYRFEGTLARLQGDAVLAFFGAPIAHEDDPVRALRAGLEIISGFEAYRKKVLARWKIPIDIRVGVNTGLVVVGEVGSDLRVEYTALGDAINVAARMEQTADPGTVRVSDETRVLAGRAFEFQALGQVTVKGKAEPMAVHRVVRFTGDELIPQDRAVVGRDAELEAFVRLCGRLSKGSGWVASVIAEGGVGKSALLAEIRRRASAVHTVAERSDADGSLAWLRAASRSYDSAIPFSTVRGMLSRWWCLPSSDDPFATIERACAAAGLEDPDAPAYLAHIGGVPMPPAQQAFIDALEHPARHARASQALIDYLGGELGRRPAVIVMEDLHWADDLSLALIEDMMNLAESRALGLVVSMRPYRSEPTWRIHEVAQRDHHHRLKTFELQPLDPTTGATLLDELLAGRDVGESTRREILARADGNPLFLEELARSVADGAWTDGPALPTSLNGMLAARLDRLDPDSRHVVEIGAVLGTEFDRQTLSAIASVPQLDRVVVGLLNKGLLVETESRALQFRHALLRETAYSTILRRTRRHIHRQVADLLIERSPDSVQAIAMHLVDGEQTERAFPYLVQSGVRAVKTMALADAIRSLATALENLPEGAAPEQIVLAHQTLGLAHALVPNLSEAAGAYQRLLAYGEEQHDARAQVSALNLLGYATATLAADLTKAQEYLESARVIAEECGDDQGMAEYHMNSCFVASMGGELGTAVLHDEQTVKYGEKMGVTAVRLAGLSRRAANFAALLDVDNARDSIAAAREVAEEVGDEHALAVVKAFGTSYVTRVAGDLRSALESARSVQPVFERYNSFYTAINLRNIGGIHLMLGEIDAARVCFLDGERVGVTVGQSFSVPAAVAGQALVAGIVGDEEAANRRRDFAMELATKPMGGMFGDVIWADIGWSRLLLGDLDGADEAFRKGFAAASLLAFVERPRMLVGRARLSMTTGDFAQASADLDAAEAFVRQKKVNGYAALIGLGTGLLCIAEGRDEDAASALLAAEGAAASSGERLLMVEILAARRRVAARSGDAEAAVGLGSRAGQALDDVAAAISDAGVRESFTRSWIRLLEAD